jgi:hypothetical protein
MKSLKYKILEKISIQSDNPVPGIWILLISFLIFSGCDNSVKNEIETNTRAKIFPEYYNLNIPSNIAPLNFIIKEKGRKFRIEIWSERENKILIQQKSPLIDIPIKKWQKILSENTGKKLKIQIWSFREKTWNKYMLIEHEISEYPIDPFLAYRLVHAVYLKWNEMGIYQRNLTNFKETPVIENFSTDHGCMNCHTFLNNDPSKMLIHFRILHSGTLIWNEGVLSKINTGTKETLSAGIYPSWHPDGNHIAFATGKISPHLTTRLNKVVDVADRASDIVIYDIEKNSVSTCEALSTLRRENMPAWSKDGKYLYYTSAPEAKENDDESLLHSKYSLMRIPYYGTRNPWGEPETIINADSTGLSISKPNMSPDGKYIICSMSDYGYFTIFHKKSDLYSINTESLELKKLELNSPSTESHSTFSSNGRWLVFSSKRMDDVLTRPFIAYFDENGVTHTPFVLPQKDPGIYDLILANYNIPELIKSKIELSPIEIRDVITGEARQAKQE